MLFKRTRQFHFYIKVHRRNRCFFGCYSIFTFFSYHLVWIRISNVLSLPLVQATKSYVMALETMNLKFCNRPVQL